MNSAGMLPNRKRWTKSWAKKRSSHESSRRSLTSAFLLDEAFRSGAVRSLRCRKNADPAKPVVAVQPRGGGPVAQSGAFVASPTAEQAREVFETRLMIEPNVARLAAERSTDASLTMLEQHLRLEHEAHHGNKRRDAIRLSGQFHVLLAEIAGNAVALRMVKELVTRTSLIIGIFGSPGVSNCRTRTMTRSSTLSAIVTPRQRRG